MSSEAVQQFCAVTGAEAQVASFWLESSQGNLEAAVAAYFEQGGDAGDAHQQTAPPAAAAQSPPAQQHASQPSAQAQPAAAHPSQSRGGAGRPAPARQGAAGIRSLADLGGNDEESDDSEEGNEYYTGGQKSGQVVKGAPKGELTDVGGLFERAKQAGAREGTQEDLPGQSAQPSSSSAFQGASNTLAGGSRTAEPAAAAAAGGPKPREYVITFWANHVFTVDDGEPRSVTDPANQQFLDAVVRGECPAELAQGGQEPVHVNLLRRGEDYTPPERPKYVAFSGKGRTLTGDNSEPARPPPNAETEFQTTWEGVDEEQPATSVQLRLVDGSRMVARLNLTHTVGDIRRFIRVSRADLPTEYRLATAFPAAALEDDSATIEAAKLQNAVVVQKR